MLSIVTSLMVIVSHRATVMMLVISIHLRFKEDFVESGNGGGAKQQGCESTGDDDGEIVVDDADFDQNGSEDGDDKLSHFYLLFCFKYWSNFFCIFSD